MGVEDIEGLNDSDVKVLMAIILSRKKRLNYENPEEDLGIGVEKKKVRNSLDVLQNRDVIKYRASGIWFFTRRFYEIDQKRAMEFYNSLSRNA